MLLLKSLVFVLMMAVISYFFLFAFIFSSLQAQCPENSFEYDDFCYVYFSNATSFPDAELSCVAASGHLPSVHNGWVNALLTSEF